jgi:hypothetical protein
MISHPNQSAHSINRKSYGVPGRPMAQHAMGSTMSTSSQRTLAPRPQAPNTESPLAFQGHRGIAGCGIGDDCKTASTLLATDDIISPTYHCLSDTAKAFESCPKPKKRGRKPKRRPGNDESDDDDDELDENGFPRDPRRRRIMERNRIAANKCRIRKRDEEEALASREFSMEDQHRNLSSCVAALNWEIYHLKIQLLRHTDCGCELIRRYFAGQAKRTVDNMTAPAMLYSSVSGSPEYCSSQGASTTGSVAADTPRSEDVQAQWSNHRQPVLHGTEFPHGSTFNSSELFLQETLGSVPCLEMTSMSMEPPITTSFETAVTVHMEPQPEDFSSQWNRWG